MDPELLRKISPKDFYEAYLREALRPDGRSINKARKVVINLNKAENSCVVRLGSTAVMCKLSEGNGFEGWNDLSFLGTCAGKITVKVLADDGNLIEAVALSYQILIEQTDFLFPFTFAELFGYFIRDPTKEEENLCCTHFTLFLSEKKVNVLKTMGSPISLSDFENLIQTCNQSVVWAKKNMQMIRSNNFFMGKFYSKYPTANKNQ